MDQRTKLLIYGAAAHMLLSMMAMIIESRKRNRGASRERISYGPIDERDRMRFEYLNNKIWKNDVTCVNMLRLNKASFFRFCKLFRDRGLLQDTIHMCVEQQVAMFLNTVGHNLRNRLVGTNYNRSGETVSRYFKKVLHAVGELRNELITPPSSTTPSKIAGNPRWDPYFKDCIGAIDGTHVRASVTKDMEPSFRGRKSHATQNVMAAVDFDLRFTYVLAGWEGTAHDALVLRDALERENGLRVPQGKFYLVDAGYGAKPGFLPPFRGVRYHLNEWGNNPVQNEKELFNLRHSSLRVTIERAFGSLKRRFKILDDATPFFPFPTQVDIVVACCIIHNWVIQDGGDELIIPETNWMPTHNHASSSSGQAREHTFMADARGGKAEGGGQCQWTPTMSSFMLTYLANIVANGTRTSSGFKKVHLNSCAKALNEHFKLNRSADQIANHLKTWKRKYNKINQLRKLSAALWDEDNFIISLDHEHYADYVKDHKTDDEFLNKPLKYYGEMVTIFGNSVATEKYAKGSNEPLATEGDDNEDHDEGDNGATAMADDNGATSSATKPNKRARIVENEDEGLIRAFKSVGERLATAIEKAATADKDVPSDLFDNVNSLPGFDDTHKSFYYAHLIEKPHIARAFNTLPFDYKLAWLAKFVSDNFPES
ncbi:uncharacterized protein LOC133925635 [Phragmites australis]|uniref:uncharacterized protein LOC133925635 n=1 Tax=Phragmites australis TaxID=29695 RepID=UPI002D7989B3|nr:uncharacterized protein LOC133925635 [Phragmites australis]